MCNNDFKTYTMKVDRLTHFEKLMVTVGSIYLAALYFVFKNQNNSWISLIISSSILICISVAYIHLLLISISYVVDIVEMERKLKIAHLADKWRRFGDSLKATYFFISFSPCILTLISIPLLYLIDYNKITLLKFSLSIFITLSYTAFIWFCAVNPFLLSSRTLRAAITKAENDEKDREKQGF